MLVRRNPERGKNYEFVLYSVFRLVFIVKHEASAVRAIAVVQRAISEWSAGVFFRSRRAKSRSGEFDQRWAFVNTFYAAQSRALWGGARFVQNVGVLL